MQDGYRQFKAALDEASCFDELIRLRFGGRILTCAACERQEAFLPFIKHRALACPACGHNLFPCHGTPFAALRTALTDWFFAVTVLRSGSGGPARELQRQAGFSRAAAERVERELKAFAPLSEAGGPFAGWLAAIAAFGRSRVGRPEEAPAPEPAPSPAPEASRPAILSAVAERPARRVPHRLLVTVAVAVAGAGLGIGSVRLLQHHEGEDAWGDDRAAPSLSLTPPRPSVMLASVDEEVAAAKAAVEAVTRAILDPPAVPAPPPAPSIRTPPGPAAPNATRPSAAPAAPLPDRALASSGDPNEVLIFGPIKVKRHLVETIVRASRVVGADPTLLMAVADKESSFATEVKARTSSATGLFQFIQGTWLGVVNEFGPRHGLEKEARAIARGSGGYTVADPAERARILDLRRDPYLSALLAGEMLKQDTLRIEKRIGRHLTGGEIYLVHFLGPDGAQTFINRVEGNPETIAAEILPKPAEANKSIFSDRGRDRSVSEVHRNFEDMIAKRLDRYREVRHVAAVATPAREAP